MFLILPQHSVSASTGWGCRVRRTAAVGGDDGDGGPGATGNIEGKLQKNGSIVLYGIVAEVTGPSYIDLQVCTYYVSFPPEFRPEFLSPEFRTKLILPWNDLIPTCVPTESRNAAEFRRFQKMTPGRNRNRKRNAHPSNH